MDYNLHIASIENISEQTGDIYNRSEVNDFRILEFDQANPFTNYCNTDDDTSCESKSGFRVQASIFDRIQFILVLSFIILVLLIAFVQLIIYGPQPIKTST